VTYSKAREPFSATQASTPEAMLDDAGESAEFT
jgi:hypothetical protein